MTRIIGGFAGSLTLAVPAAGTRPTSDMVREAIFSALQARDALADARVLDLYAGSGALGLEAASRGAAAVTLVDNNQRAASTCRRNAAHVLGAAPRGKTVAVDVSSSPVQAFISGARQFWDVVFLDPPYDLDNGEVSHNLEALVPRLAPHAVVVLERSSRSPVPTIPAELLLDRRKEYGDTAVYWLSLSRT
jgi:16S rRNA (guanine966-N2)-methyltransferase